MDRTFRIEDQEIDLLGLGTWALNGKRCARVVSRAIEMGYRHLDTAQMYRNEKEVGKGIAASGTDREKVFITTKISTGNMDPVSIARSTEESLKKLGTEYVDMLLIHWPTPGMDLEACLSAMCRLRDDGKVRHVGVSNFSPDLFRKATDLGPVICNQVEFSPYVNQNGNLMLARETGTLITAYSPLAKGRVSRDDLLSEIGKDYGKSAAQVALRWLLQHEYVSVIPKASSDIHLEENMEVFDFELSRDDMEKISAINK